MWLGCGVCVLGVCSTVGMECVVGVWERCGMVRVHVCQVGADRGCDVAYGGMRGLY